MAKVRVQDATKEVSAGASRLLKSVSDASRQAQETLKKLRALENELTAGQASKQDEKRRDTRVVEAPVFMNAFSTDQFEANKPEQPAAVSQVAAQPRKDTPRESAADTKQPLNNSAKPEIKPAPQATKQEVKSVLQATKQEVKLAQQPEAQDNAKVAPKTEIRPEDKPAQTAEPEAIVTSAETQPMQEVRPAQPQQRPQGQPPVQQPLNRPAAQQGVRGPRPMGQPGQYGRPVNPPQGQQGQYGRPVNPQGQQGQYGRPMNPQGQQGQYGRPVGQPGQYGRPVNPQGQQGQYGRPVNPQGQQGQYGRPVGQPGQYGRPVNPQGQQGQYGRPAGQPGQYGNRPPMGGGPRPGGFGSGAPRPGGFGGGANRPAGGGAGRKSGPELAPTVEKERVSNYDPNKKNYVRQHDPERVAKNRRQLARSEAPTMQDDEIMRGGKRKKNMKQLAPKPEPIKIEKAYMTAETVTVKDLSERIGKPVGEIIKKLLLMDILATINSELDYDTALLVCSDFGIEFEKKLDKTAEDVLSDEDVEDTEGDLVTRPPVITIMGHVDHGKTSLLDYIRKTRVTASEAGGITQHIGAYTVSLNDHNITFLDTPGHEAFTSMRARGAQCTDIAILVVAADDGVMPQTIEAINHAKAAGVPIIVAINKCDRPGAEPEKIRQQLTEYSLVCEEWGGDTIMVEVSAATGAGIDSLLEMILLQSEVLDLRANPNRLARGIIVEARLDKGRGPVATVLVQNGTLHVGDTIVAGTAYGRVRAMVNDRGERVNDAGPSVPVEVVGWNDVPDAGDQMSAVEDDRLSRLVAEERKQKLRDSLIKTQSKMSLDDLFGQIEKGQIKDMNIIIKADVQGSVEAVRQSLEKLSNDEVHVNVIHGGAGAINEGDVMLASASNALIVGFNVRPDAKASATAEREQVELRLYRVIYDAIEEIQSAMKGMLAPKFKENILGRAQVRQTFKVTGVGTIAGCMVTDGKMQRNAQVRLLRDNVVVHEGKIDSLKRFKDDAKEVATGFECGIGLANYNDVKDGDVIECFLMEEIAQ